MSKRTFTAHINCSPWVEDGRWNIIIEHDYYHVVGLESDDDSNANLIEEILGSALDEGVIHSYHIQRHDDPAPTIHFPKGNPANG